MSINEYVRNRLYSRGGVETAKRIVAIATVQLAKHDFRSDDWGSALRRIDSLPRPLNGETMFIRGVALHQLGRDQDAIATYESLIASNLLTKRDADSIRNNLCYLASQTKQNVKFIRDPLAVLWEIETLQNPNDEHYYGFTHTCACLLARRGKYDQALNFAKIFRFEKSIPKELASRWLREVIEKFDTPAAAAKARRWLQSSSREPEIARMMIRLKKIENGDA